MRKLYHGYQGPAKDNSQMGAKSLKLSLKPLETAEKRMVLLKNPHQRNGGREKIAGKQHVATCCKSLST